MKWYRALRIADEVETLRERAIMMRFTHIVSLVWTRGSRGELVYAWSLLQASSQRHNFKTLYKCPRHLKISDSTKISPHRQVCTYFLYGYHPFVFTIKLRTVQPNTTQVLLQLITMPRHVRYMFRPVLRPSCGIVACKNKECAQGRHNNKISHCCYTIKCRTIWHRYTYKDLKRYYLHKRV